MAIEWDKGNAAYWFKKALELDRSRNLEVGMWNSGERDKKQQGIIEVLEEAVRLNPFNAKYHLKLGWEYTYLWREADYHQKWLPAADISMGRAAYFSGVKTPNLHVEMGKYWVMRSKTIYPSNPGHNTAWAKACWHYKKAQEIDGNKGMLKKITQNIWNSYPDREMVLEAVHERFLGQAEKLLGGLK